MTLYGPREVPKAKYDRFSSSDGQPGSSSQARLALNLAKGTMSEEAPSLYDRIGGEVGVEKLVNAFYVRVLTDPELAPFFEHASVEKLKAMQKEFFSEALGGPLFYSGRSMREVHAGRGIKKFHLRLFTDHLLATLEEKQKDLALTRRDIDAIHSRIALEADEISGGGSEIG